MTTMPNRILREGILTSAKLAQLGWAEEVFYRRLMSVVDDFGRYYADVGLLRAACYPRQLNKVSDSDVGKWLACVQKAALVRVYPAEDGESYLELLNFNQQVRAKKSKFPHPPDDATHVHSRCTADAQHPQANAHLGVCGDGDVSGDVDVCAAREKPPDASKAESPAASACKVMRAAGMQDVNPSHPKLTALLAAGITQEELQTAAADAVGRGKGFAYALAAAEGRRRDAATEPLPAARQQRKAAPATRYAEANRSIFGAPKGGEVIDV